MLGSMNYELIVEEKKKLILAPPCRGKKVILYTCAGTSPSPKLGGQFLRYPGIATVYTLLLIAARILNLPAIKRISIPRVE